MPILARIIFGCIEWSSRRGFVPTREPGAAPDLAQSARVARRRTGVRGETFAYWYLRRHGYTIIARNFTVPGVKGEIDLVGYDGAVLAFIEVKTRTSETGAFGLPEDAVTPAKRRHLSRMACQLRAQWRLRERPFRFDVVAIESHFGARPAVRLHKGAFN